MMIDRKWRNAVVACSVIAAAAPAWALTATATFHVTSTVVGVCNVSANTLAFGSVPSMISPAIDSDSGIFVTCPAGQSYSVALNAGAGSGATLAVRKMMFGANVLNYSIYKDAARTIVWGDGSSGSQVHTGLGTGLTEKITTYGRLFVQTQANVGAYMDTITVTLIY